MMLIIIAGIPIEFISLMLGVFSCLNINSIFIGGDKMNVNALISKVKNGIHEMNL